MTKPSTTAALPPFRSLSDLVREHARQRPQALAMCDDESTLSWAQLDQLVDSVAASLQRDGLRPGDVVALCAAPCVRYAAVFVGVLRSGAVVAPLSPSVTPQVLAAMLGDAQARVIFVDASTQQLLQAGALVGASLVMLDQAAAVHESPHGQNWDDWLASDGIKPKPVDTAPEDPCNIIYSSGTTGTPKGIVQSHGMRWAHVVRGLDFAYGAESITLLATPLYSNTTLVSFFPTLGWGGCVRLMARFDALRYLQTAQAIRASHTMLVPVQYQRIMALPQFGEFDLSSFKAKFCTSAPFRAELKADVLARWPGGLVEFYGMTEGGGTCILVAQLHPDKLHTVGQPAATSDMRLIDEEGHELPAGAIGEVVGHSPGMMTGYHGQPEQTREVEWFDAHGKRFIRTGDVGRFDADGFLTLLDRRKDMIISGGFNIYPSDLEAELRQHPAVEDVAVTGVPSEQWGETPVAFVCPRSGATDEAAQIMAWYNARAGKTQRLAALYFVDELPRSAIGKVLKRELRERHQTMPL
jgi:long-chain acyl-CoA synthetase